MNKIIVLLYSRSSNPVFNIFYYVPKTAEKAYISCIIISSVVEKIFWFFSEISKKFRENITKFGVIQTKKLKFL